MPIYDVDGTTDFPPYHLAIPEGVLAISSDVDPNRLAKAYASGIFCWYNEYEPVQWFAPKRRSLIYPDKFHLSRSAKKAIRKSGWKASFDTHTMEIIYRCATIERKHEEGTWITDELYSAYHELDQRGIMRSVGVLDSDSNLVGGVYGVLINGVFTGESMFSAESNGSKAALHAVFEHVTDLFCLDSQVINDHTALLGAVEVDAAEFLSYLSESTAAEWPFGEFPLTV